MNVERVLLREVVMPLKEALRTVHGTYGERRFIVVEAHQGDRVGYGEVPVLPEPGYHEETLASAWHLLASYLVPKVFRRNWESPEELAEQFRLISRNCMAKTGLETAVWDLYARCHSRSLSELLGGERGHAVAAGIVLGLEEDPARLVEKAGRALEAGYRRIKIKIRPGWDAIPLERLRNAYGGIPLAADANGAYGREHIGELRKLDRFKLQMIEQPFHRDDLLAHVRLQEQMETPVCLDETADSLERAMQAIELNCCRVINIKPGRLGGLTEARKLHDFCQEHGIPVWCGGLLESGIGRAHNLALAALPNFSLPADISASQHYWEEDLIEPEIQIGTDGFIRTPEGESFGYRVRTDVLEHFTVRRRMFAPPQ